SGDPSLAYRCALAAGKQIRAIGSNVIQGPCLDVNTNPGNPEVGTRAYSDNTEDTVIYALQSLKGFQEAGIMCTGKHFPGRGESEKDAHWGLPSVDVDYDTLMSVHVKPYKALIEAGLPYIMTAHCMYPALGVAEEPGSTSCRMVTEFLRKELGFQGVIVADNTIMGGLLMKFEMSDAIVRCLIAGHDMVLCRDDSPARLKIVNGIIDAVKSGRYPEKQLDESVYRVLSSRWDMGLPENGGKVDALKAAEPFNDPFVASTAKEAAEKTILVLRDREKLLPLDPDKKVLLIEQIFPTHLEANTHYCHPGLMWEGMIKASDNAGSVEINFKATDQDRERVFRRLGEADIIVMTNYYYHKYVKSFSDFVRE
ncbi:MAG: hypothetical protein K8F30_10645, partial [Taibaiella sp.]|nr:hypothetical protein [Taibaiella sp.]